MTSREKLDKNNMERIKALMKVKGSALSLDLNNLNNFFNHFSNVVDIPLFFIINDEISNCLERGPIKDILKECLDSKDPEIEISVCDMKDLFVNRADFLIGSILLDFNVNAFSAFERWMSDIYDFIKPKYPSSDRKKKELVNNISKYNKIENEIEQCELLSKIMANCNSHVSSMTKIKYVLAKVSKNYEPYITYTEDLELIEFLSRVRNTVHTGGFNTSPNNYSINFDGDIYTLNSGEGFKSDSHAKSILIWERVIEIYTYAYIFVNEEFPNYEYDGVLYHTYPSNENRQ